jgi:cation:H+ antiporter
MITVLQLVGGFALLLFGAEFLVRGAVSVARRLKVAPMIIGMTIVAYGTTSPELVVSLQAAYDDLPGISVGNVVGSNICNILLILGTSALIFPIAVKPQLLYRDATMMMGAALLFTALAFSGTIERWQGGLMVGLLVAYTLYAFRQERIKGKANDPGDMAEELAEEFTEGPRSLWLALLSVAGGVVAVVTGAKLLIAAAMDQHPGRGHLQSPEDHGAGRRGDADPDPGADPRLRPVDDDRRDRHAAGVPAAQGRPDPACRSHVPGRLRGLHGRAVLRGR